MSWEHGEECEDESEGKPTNMVKNVKIIVGQDLQKWGLPSQDDRSLPDQDEWGDSLYFEPARVILESMEKYGTCLIEGGDESPEGISFCFIILTFWPPRMEIILFQGPPTEVGILIPEPQRDWWNPL